MEVNGTSFIIQEFVPRSFWQEWKENSIWFVNPNTILFAQWLKDQTFSTVTINDWCFGGSYQFSGLRPFDCKIGAEFSQHKFGNAIDVKVKGWSGEQIRDLIRKYYHFLNQTFGLTTIEKNTPTWCHVDFRFTGLTYLYEVKFKIKKS
jgi:hypothetical protein